MSRWENPWTMTDGRGPRRTRRIVGWATDWPDGHAVIDELAIVRQVELSSPLGRRAWITTAVLRCACGAKIERTSPPAWSDPRRSHRWHANAMLMVSTLHGDHCRQATGRRPRRMLLAGPILEEAPR